MIPASNQFPERPFLRLMSLFDASQFANRMKSLALATAALLFVKVFLSILYQYRFYFPADFESDFLSIRRDTFHGLYRAAFYVHIVSAPVSLMSAVSLVLSGDARRFPATHRLVGRVLAIAVFTCVSPSGLVMAAYAPAGPIAASGLATLAIATAATLFLAIRHARLRQFGQHRLWAIRCFILLVSPLLLRLISGFVIVMQLDPDLWDRLNPWISWVVPLAIFEIGRHFAPGSSPSTFSRPIPEARP
jgi:hypothetical protein